MDGENNPTKTEGEKINEEVTLVYKASQNQIDESKAQMAEQANTIIKLTERAIKAEHELLKAKIAYEYKIPYELSGRLAGETEAEIRKDAENFAKMVSRPQTAPLAYVETAVTDPQKSALSGLLRKLNLRN